MKLTILGLTLLFAAFPALADENPINNFHVVVPGKIYRGADPESNQDGLAYLAKIGVVSDVDLEGGDTILGIPVSKDETQKHFDQERSLAQKDGIKNFFGESLDALKLDQDDQDPEINHILEIVANPANQPIFIHCQLGSDRTGLIVALYRVFYQGCTPDQAHEEWMQYGHSGWLKLMDAYFYAKVKNDPRTRETPAATCPLSSQPICIQ